jgi:serine/threonine-protein kinase
LRRIEGKYEILEKLREGGMGAIYKVRHRLLDEIRVIKLMRQQLVEDEELKARFLREARMAIKLRHPNIAQLYDFTLDADGTAFIVMEFIDGTNLDEVAALHGPPSLDFTLEVARQSLKALGYLHTRGFIHRDISPDNLMLTEDEDGQPLVKLIDLGLARTLESVGDSPLTHTGTFLGKLRYAAPEQFQVEGRVDARTDLYAFGVVLYVLLTNRFPVQGQDAPSLMAGHLFRPPLDFAESDPTGRVPAGLRAAVLKLLAKDPEERFTSARELSLVLGAFRAASGLAPEELKRLLSKPFTPAGSSFRPEAGSTQGRLDESFDLVSTPRPVPLVTLPAPAAEGSAVYTTQDEMAEARRFQEEKNRELAAALAGIEAALARGDYRAAEILLYGAEASLGEQEAFAALYEQVAGLRRRAVADMVAAYLESARRLAEEQDFRGALAEVLKALHLDPESREAAVLQAGIEAGEKRLAELTAWLASARELAARQDLKGALRELRKSADLDPQNLEVHVLTHELEAALREKARSKRREQRRALSFKKIEERLAGEDLAGAEALLAKAAAAHGEEAVEALRERLGDLRRAERRIQGLNAVVAHIRDRLDHGDLEEAGALLDQAVLRFQAAESLREPYERLEQMRRALAAHLDKASQLAGEMRLDAAQAELAAAAELAPGNPGLLALKREVAVLQRRKRVERHRAAELALAVAALEVHLDRGELETVAKLLESTAAVHGDADPLPRLRSRLEGLERRARKALDQTAAAPPPAPPFEASEADEISEFWTATQAVAELLSTREPQQALRELQRAAERFGERAELRQLRRQIAVMLLDS